MSSSGTDSIVSTAWGAARLDGGTGLSNGRLVFAVELFVVLDVDVVIGGVVRIGGEENWAVGAGGGGGVGRVSNDSAGKLLSLFMMSNSALDGVKFLYVFVLESYGLVQAITLS